MSELRRRMGSHLAHSHFLCIPHSECHTRIVPWRQACAHTHMFTFVSLETRHVLLYIHGMFSFVLFTFAPRMSEAASTIICGHRLYWLIGGFVAADVGSKYRGVFSLLVPCGMIETTIQHLASCQCTGARRRYVSSDDDVTSVSLRSGLHLMGMYACMYVDGGSYDDPKIDWLEADPFKWSVMIDLVWNRCCSVGYLW